MLTCAQKTPRHFYLRGRLTLSPQRHELMKRKGPRIPASERVQRGKYTTLPAATSLPCRLALRTPSPVRGSCSACPPLPPPPCLVFRTVSRLFFLHSISPSLPPQNLHLPSMFLCPPRSLLSPSFCLIFRTHIFFLYFPSKHPASTLLPSIQLTPMIRRLLNLHLIPLSLL